MTPLEEALQTPKAEKHRFHVFIDDELFAEVTRLSAKAGVSRAQVLRVAIQRGVGYLVRQETREPNS